MVRRDDVPWTEVQKLNAQGWSYRQLAEKFGAAESTFLYGGQSVYDLVIGIL